MEVKKKTSVNKKFQIEKINRGGIELKDKILYWSEGWDPKFLLREKTMGKEVCL